MYAGELHQQNLHEVLRGFSQRRKQGVLEVVLPNRKLEISFVQGRIIEVRENSQYPAVDLATKLTQAGYPLPAGDDWKESYGALFERLNSPQPVISTESYERAIRHRVLELLYSLGDTQGGYFRFNTQMVEYERDYAPSVSVGQLLLDLVALDTDRSRFASLCPSSDVTLESTGLAAEGLSPEELLIVEGAKAGCTLADLRVVTMLSSYHLQDGILRLIDLGLLRVRSDGISGGSARPASSSLSAGLVSQLEASIDSAFELPEGLLEDSVAEAPGPVQGETSPISSVQAEVSLRRAPLSVRLRVLSVQLLNRAWVIHATIAVFLAAALLAPLVSWRDIVALFGY